MIRYMFLRDQMYSDKNSYLIVPEYMYSSEFIIDQIADNA